MAEQRYDVVPQEASDAAGAWMVNIPMDKATIYLEEANDFMKDYVSYGIVEHTGDWNLGSRRRDIVQKYNGNDPDTDYDIELSDDEGPTS